MESQWKIESFMVTRRKKFGKHTKNSILLKQNINLQKAIQ